MYHSVAPPRCVYLPCNMNGGVRQASRSAGAVAVRHGVVASCLPQHHTAGCCSFLDADESVGAAVRRVPVGGPTFPPSRRRFPLPHHPPHGRLSSPPQTAVPSLEGPLRVNPSGPGEGGGEQRAGAEIRAGAHRLGRAVLQLAGAARPRPPARRPAPALPPGGPAAPGPRGASAMAARWWVAPPRPRPVLRARPAGPPSHPFASPSPSLTRSPPSPAPRRREPGAVPRRQQAGACGRLTPGDAPACAGSPRGRGTGPT